MKMILISLLYFVMSGSNINQNNMAKINNPGQSIKNDGWKKLFDEIGRAHV